MQMEVPVEENWTLVRRAKARGARILLNIDPAAPVPEDILAMRDLLLVNGGEAVALAHQAGFSEIGSASWRERVSQYVSVSVVAVSLQKKREHHCLHPHPKRGAEAQRMT